MARPGRLAIAWLAIRPHTLPLSISPVLVGSVAGWVQVGLVRLDITLAAACSAACMQIGANLQNDAVDALNGTDGPEREGPARVTQRGWATPGQVLRAAWLAFLLATLAGLYLVAVGGWPLVLLGLLAVLAAYTYSGGPRPISRGPFGELVVLIFFGPVAVAGVAWLYSGEVSTAAILGGLAVGLPAAAVLTINNLRDHAGDARAGRRTLAILLGPGAAARLVVLLLLAVVPVLAVLAAHGRPWTGVVLALLAMGLAWRAGRSVFRARTAEDYTQALKLTAGYQLLLSVLLGLGVIGVLGFF